MIRHTVMWHLKDHAEEADKANHVQKAKALLLPVPKGAQHSDH